MCKKRNLNTCILILVDLHAVDNQIPCVYNTNQVCGTASEYIAERVCEMPRFEQIELFIEVYNAGNITKAAEKLFVTQQSVSHSLKRLEEDVGRKLFVRTVNGVRPTPEGERFYSTFSPIVLSYRDALERYAASDPESVINLAITPAVIRNLTPNVLFSFFREFAIFV